MTMGYAYLNIEVLKLTEKMIFLELVKHIKRPYFSLSDTPPQNYLSSRYLLFFTSPKNYLSSRYLLFFTSPKMIEVVDTDFNCILMVNNFIN